MSRSSSITVRCIVPGPDPEAMTKKISRTFDRFVVWHSEARHKYGHLQLDIRLSTVVDSALTASGINPDRTA
jgi:hypothetical protein